MSEFSFSNTSKKNEFSSILLSDLYRFCFSIFSHPLYFSYFIFFSPYLLKLLSFLSPLFITTTLLVLALLTFSPSLVQEKSDSENSESKLGFVFSLSQSVLEKVWSKGSGGEKYEEIGYLEEFEAYLVMFQASIFEEFEPKSDEDCSEFFECSPEGKDASGPAEEPDFVNFDEEPVVKDDHQLEAKEPIAEVKSLESLFQENAEPEANSLESLFQENKDLEDLFPPEEEKEVKPIGTEFEKVEEESKDKLSGRSGSKVMRNRSIGSKVMSANSELENGEKGDEYYSPNYWSPSNSTRKFMTNSKISDEFYSPSSLGSYGSMRKEKEWRRTLACKLFEERHNANGTEGMDMLWETYESESDKIRSMKGKKGEIGFGIEDDEEEDDDIDEGKLCCLQALKFSAGKMNLGMGRPNLVKITKAIKGFGWLHHHAKHGRKG